MNERQRARLLRQIAARDFPDTYDRWPAIRQRISGEATAQERASGRSRRWRTARLGARQLATWAVYLMLFGVVAGMTALVFPFMVHRGAAPPSPPASAPSRSPATAYHLVAVQHFGPGVDTGFAPGATTVTLEQWSAGDGRLRQEAQFKDSQGAIVLSVVSVANGRDEWAAFTYDGKTDVMHWSLQVAGTPVDNDALVATKQAAGDKAGAVGTPVDDAALRATKQAMVGAGDPGWNPTWTSLDATKVAMTGAGQGTPPANAPAAPAGSGTPVPVRPNLLVPAWSPFHKPNPSGVDDLIKIVGMSGCGTAQWQADTTIAGRAAYVVAVTSAGTCPKSANTGDRLTVRADQETLKTLGYDQYTADGALVASYEVSTIAYGVSFPDSTFAFTPPAGAYVCDADGNGDTPCRTKGPQRR